MNFIKNGRFALLFFIQTTFSAQFADNLILSYLAENPAETNTYGEFLYENTAENSAWALNPDDTEYQTALIPSSPSYSQLSFTPNRLFDEESDTDAVFPLSDSDLFTLNILPAQRIENDHEPANYRQPKRPCTVKKRSSSERLLPADSLNFDFPSAPIAAWSLLSAGSSAIAPTIDDVIPAASAEPDSAHYQCKLCSKRFKKMNFLGTHWFEKHLIGKKEFAAAANHHICPDPSCNKNFSRKSIMLEHIAVRHSHLCELICNLCDKGFFTLESFTKHTDYSCPQKDCTYVTHKKSNLESHKLQHKELLHHEESITSPCSNNYQCKLCDESFEKIDLSRSHWLETHMNHKRERTGPFSCPIPSCIFKSIRKNAIFEHAEAHHPEFCDTVCVTCHRGFLTKDRLHKHVDYSCSIKDCTYITSKKRDFKCHERNHKEQLEAEMSRRLSKGSAAFHQFQCKHCSMVFKEMSELGAHWFENYIKPKSYSDVFVCPDQNCAFSGSLKSVMLKHVAVAHAEFCSIICKGCNKGFFTQDSFDTHLHYLCPEKDCTYVTHIKHNLLRHKKTHQNQLKKPKHQEISGASSAHLEN